MWGDKDTFMGCLTEAGCFDTKPAFEFLRATLDKFPEGFKRRTVVASGNVGTGNYE